MTQPTGIIWSVPPAYRAGPGHIIEVSSDVISETPILFCSCGARADIGGRLDGARIDFLSQVAAEHLAGLCTGLAAAWCPVHGDCTCPARENAMDDPNCPLHAPDSTHAGTGS